VAAHVVGTYAVAHALAVSLAASDRCLILRVWLQATASGSFHRGREPRREVRCGDQWLQHDRGNRQAIRSRRS